MLYTKTQLAKWKKDKTVFYIKKKQKKNKKKDNRFVLTPYSHSIKKKYNMYLDETDLRVGTVTYEEVEFLSKCGIKVLAEKDGFPC